MFTLLLALCFAALYGMLAWRQYSWALALFVFCLPTYLIRFNIGPLPSTLLELMFGILFLVWLVKYCREDLPGLKQFFTQHRALTIALGIFILASVAGIFVSDQRYISLGQWRAYFLEPLIFFKLLIARRNSVNTKTLISALLASTVPMSVLALIQALTGALYPPSLWDDLVGHRAVAYFTSPNALALYLVPALLLGLGLYLEKRNKLVLAALIIGTLGLLASQSVGGMAAFAVGLFTVAAVRTKNTLRLWRAAFGVIGIAIIIVLLPPSQHVLNTKLQSGNNRLTLWRYTSEFLSASPKNFVLGAGIRMYFRKVQKPHYNVRELERLIYPHNIVLNFWSEIGLFGMLAFVTILGLLLKTNWQHQNSLVAVGLFAALITLLAHGLIDVPYFKNDLAMVFWILAALSYFS